MFVILYNGFCCKTAKAIFFLETLWLEEPDIEQQISPEAWQEFMGAVYQSLLDMQINAVRIE